MLKKMSTFLFALLGLTVGETSDPCGMRREIAPCTCRLEEPKMKRIVVACEEMVTFADIIKLLQDKFPPEQDVSLKINYSRLNDMTGRSFKELGMKIKDLKLCFDDLSILPDTAFNGLNEVEYFSLADNNLGEVPRDVLRKMPKLKTLDLGRSRISALWKKDFQDLPVFQHLLIPGNQISMIESDAFPRTVRRMHIGMNLLKDLNGSLRNLRDLEWLFINMNHLTSLQEQLPPEAPKLNLIYATHNRISKLPVELRNYPSIDSLFFSHNELSSLEGILQKSRHLKILDISHNKINTLADDEFTETELMDTLKMGHNHLKRLNLAFLTMKKLRELNLTHNYLTEFSFEEIRGLKNLRMLDLSHNKISSLSGRMENVVEVETRLEVLRLEHNEIKALGGSLLGIHGLQELNLSHNKLMNIAPNDLIGLEDLRILDISYNNLKTLEETSKTYLPRLQELIANNNLLQALDKDFHGLPALCKADLSKNQIASIGSDLISKTRCKIEGVSGVLRVYLYGNPVLCDPEFNVTADLMEGNFTLLQGDFAICPLVIQSTEMSPANHSTATDAPLTSKADTESIKPPEPIIMRPQLVINDRVPFPLLIAPPLNEDGTDDDKKELLMGGEKAPHFDILTTVYDDKGNGDNNITREDLKPAVVEGNILGSVILHAPVVVKDEDSSNVTLMIPIQNGAIRKDHAVDQYIQKNEEIDILNQTKVPGLITNIDIVEIKPLPNESSKSDDNSNNDNND